MSTEGYCTMSCTSLQRHSLTLTNENLGCTLCHLGFHALSHQVASQSALSLGKHTLGYLATRGTRKPITPSITCEGQRSTAYTLPEARLILLIGNILQPVLIVGLHQLSCYLAHYGITQACIHDILCTTLWYHILHLQLIELSLQHFINHRLKLLRISAQSSIHAISLHHLEGCVAHIVQELRILVKTIKLLLQCVESLLRVFGLISLILRSNGSTKAKIGWNVLTSFHTFIKSLTSCLLCLVILIHHRRVHILADNARKSLINILIHQLVLNNLII